MIECESCHWLQATVPVRLEMFAKLLFMTLSLISQYILPMFGVNLKLVHMLRCFLYHLDDLKM